MVGEWKQLVNFCEKGSFLVILAAYLLRGLFYRRTNLAISIRYISEKHLQESKNTTSCQDGTKRKRKWYGSIWPIPKRKSSIHSAYAHRLRPRRKSSWKESQHSLRYGWRQERGISGFATLRYRALSYTVTSKANVATPACPSLPQRKGTLGRCP